MSLFHSLWNWAVIIWHSAAGVVKCPTRYVEGNRNPSKFCAAFRKSWPDMIPSDSSNRAMSNMFEPSGTVKLK